MRVIVTRPAAQAASWVEALASHGIEAVALPLMRICAPIDSAPVATVWRQGVALCLRGRGACAGQACTAAQASPRRAPCCSQRRRVR